MTIISSRELHELGKTKTYLDAITKEDPPDVTTGNPAQLTVRVVRITSDSEVKSVARSLATSEFGPDVDTKRIEDVSSSTVYWEGPEGGVGISIAETFLYNQITTVSNEKGEVVFAIYPYLSWIEKAALAKPVLTSD